MACSSSCATQDCPNYGTCMRNKGIKTYLLQPHKGIDSAKDKKFNAELNAYEAAIRQGVQPEGTSMAKIERAMQISEATGVAFDAGAS